MIGVSSIGKLTLLSLVNGQQPCVKTLIRKSDSSGVPDMSIFSRNLSAKFFDTAISWYMFWSLFVYSNPQICFIFEISSASASSDADNSNTLSNKTKFIRLILSNYSIWQCVFVKKNGKNILPSDQPNDVYKNLQKRLYRQDIEIWSLFRLMLLQVHHLPWSYWTFSVECDSMRPTIRHWSLSFSLYQLQHLCWWICCTLYRVHL